MRKEKGGVDGGGGQREEGRGMGGEGMVEEKDKGRKEIGGSKRGRGEVRKRGDKKDG